jgi:hypothetical protein
MKEPSIEVDHVVMAAPSFAEVDHAVVTKVSDYAPHCALRQLKIACDFLHRRVGANSHVKENTPLGRKEGPISPFASPVGCPPTGFPLLCRWCLADSLVHRHDCPKTKSGGISPSSQRGDMR